MCACISKKESSLGIGPQHLFVMLKARLINKREQTDPNQSKKKTSSFFCRTAHTCPFSSRALHAFKESEKSGGGREACKVEPVELQQRPVCNYAEIGWR